MGLNFKISELIHSDTSIKYNINNMPDVNSLDSLLNLIFYCLQPIRDKIKKPMVITSGYRSLEVNRLVGGATNSQHRTGQAVDFKISGMTPRQIVDFIKKSGIEYDQLIEEYSNNTSWVHISYNKGKNRKQTLLYKNGVYTKI